jgi:hypothetical protein
MPPGTRNFEARGEKTVAISDVLFEAGEEIKRYLADGVTIRGEPELRAKVVDVLSAMRKLQEELDTPPSELLTKVARVDGGVTMDDDTVEMPEHVRRELDEEDAERRRTILAFEREIVLAGYEDDEVFAPQSKVVDLEEFRRDRESSDDWDLEPLYSKSATEQLVDYYQDRIVWLLERRRWVEEWER